MPQQFAKDLSTYLGAVLRGVTRQAFPVELGVSLALRIMVHPTEMDAGHKLQVVLMTEDGGRVAAVDAEFKINNPGDLEPGEEASVALPISLPPQVQLASAGAYSFEVLIDGVHNYPSHFEY